MRCRARSGDPVDPARFGDAGTPVPMLIVLLVLAFGPDFLATAGSVSHRACESAPALPGGTPTTLPSTARTHGR